MSGRALLFCSICLFGSVKQVMKTVDHDREPDTVRGVFCRVTGSGPSGLKSDNKLSLLEEESVNEKYYSF